MLRRSFLKAVVALAAAVGLPLGAEGQPNAARRMPTPERSPKIPEGATITCPACGDRIATALRDIFGGDLVRSADFEAHGGYILAGAEMRCRCGMRYIRARGTGRQVHTDRGWL